MAQQRFLQLPAPAQLPPLGPRLLPGGATTSPNWRLRRAGGAGLGASGGHSTHRGATETPG
eukprot:7320444-Alexandrium_andersonii.AAC.1